MNNNFKPKRRIDRLQLAEYFNNLSISYNDAIQLKNRDEVVCNAALEFYGENTYFTRVNILRILIRNTDQISRFFKNIPSLSTSRQSVESVDTFNNSNNINDNDINNNYDRVFNDFENTSPCVTDDEIDIDIPIRNMFENSFKLSRDRQILPVGCKNVFIANKSIVDNRKRTYICPIFEGDFYISKEEWHSIYQGGNKLKEGIYVYFLKEKLFEFVNNVCVINVRSYYFSKNLSNLCIYAYCGHIECKSFVFKISFHNNMDQPLYHFKVFSSCVDYCHSKLLTRHVKGIERKLLGDKYKNKKPLHMATDCILKSSKNILESNHLQKIKSHGVYRNIISDNKRKLDRDSDDVIDLLLMRRENPNYIQLVGEPLFAYVHGEEQMFLLKNAIRDAHPLKKITAYVDATGSIVRKPKTVETKRILLYSIVIRLKDSSGESGTVCSVSDFISSRHDITTISAWLSHFKTFWTNFSMTWPIFDRVVTDFSMAELNALSQAFNEMSFIAYINNCYNIIYNNGQNNNLTHLALCCAHLMKIFVNCINSHYNDSNVGTILKESLAAVSNMKTIREVEQWFESFTVLTCSKLESLAVIYAKNNIINLNIGQAIIVNEEIELTFKTDSINNNKIRDSTYKSSLFYKHFCLMKDKVLIKVNNDGIGTQNKFYSPNFYNDILVRFITYLPLWTSIVNGERSCNAPIEKYFGTLKNSLFNNTMPEKCSRVIRGIRKHIVSIFEMKKFNIGKSQCASKKRKREICEEGWKKKSKRVHSYYKALYSNKLKSQEIVSQVKHYIPLQFFSNGLIKSKNYYSQTRSHEYAVCRFENNVFFQNILYSASFRTLRASWVIEQNEKWLDNFVIEFSISLFINNNPDYCLLSCAISKEIDKEKRGIANKIENLNNSATKILMVFNQGNNHWVLIYVDLKNGTFGYLDPINNSNGRNFFQKFLTFFNKYNLKYFDSTVRTDLKLNTYQYPLQNDNVNCGVYCIYYAKCLINSETFSETFNPETYRECLQEMLLLSAKDMREYCLYCGSDESFREMIYCEMCQRFIHLRCIRNRDGTFQKPPEEEFFICQICLEFKKDIS
ncbi:unnamed protein product [Psylliodes chrysocephalus]|uniref:Ubiquitin-like protease family profile domain-containing protein n=1 Tax=Psylliodes chrysocephalus TaxID=3402493 RepID=A0A9P0CQG2_9CUCU|nr:unnamed protein product [Psylliodes chrysocephala]